MTGSEAIWGLGGIFVGAILTGAVNAVAEWNRRRLQKRAAARVIYGDLFRAQDILHTALEIGEWGQLPNFEFEDWQRYRDALSAAMPAGPFHTVAGSYYGLGTLNERRRVDSEHFPALTAEDGYLQISRGLSCIFDEGTTRRDIRKMASAWGEADLEIEPGQECQVFWPQLADGLHVILIAPAPPLLDGDEEQPMVKVEIEGERLAVPKASLRPIST